MAGLALAAVVTVVCRAGITAEADGNYVVVLCRFPVASVLVALWTTGAAAHWIAVEYAAALRLRSYWPSSSPRILTHCLSDQLNADIAFLCF